MTFKNISGNEHLVNDIKRIIKSGDLHHAYIIEGPWSLNKKDIAKAVIQAILCEEAPGEGCGRCSTCIGIENESYMDLTVVSANTAKSGGNVLSVRDEAIELLIERLKHKPYQGKRNVAIICDADTMTVRAENRLLKTLEEPPVGTIIMILSENVTKLEQTILSRCIHLRAFDGGEKDGEYMALAKEITDMISAGEKYYRIKSVLDNLDKSREAAYRFLDSMEDVYHEKLIQRNIDFNKNSIFTGIKKIEEARKKINANVGVQYALKQMLLEIGG